MARQLTTDVVTPLGLLNTRIHVTKIMHLSERPVTGSRNGTSTNN